MTEDQVALLGAFGILFCVIAGRIFVWFKEHKERKARTAKTQSYLRPGDW